MSTRHRLVFVAIPVLLVACNAISGISDYAVESDPPDSSVAPESSAPDASDAGVDAPADEDCASRPLRIAADCENDAATNAGPPMVSYIYGNDSYHCIDTTEVTTGQYQQFLTERGTTNMCGQPPECAWNTSYEPLLAVSDESLPQVGVDWCDAFMYCQWAGKHLCGTMGHVPIHPEVPAQNVESSDQANPGIDLWYAFCFDQANTYFYGPTYEPDMCNDGTDSRRMLDEVGAYPGCHGTGISTKVYDLTGNAAEWEWSCEDGGASANCAARGGSAISNLFENFECSAAVPYPRNTRGPFIGFRCCAE